MPPVRFARWEPNGHIPSSPLLCTIRVCFSFHIFSAFQHCLVLTTAKISQRQVVLCLPLQFLRVCVNAIATSAPRRSFLSGLSKGVDGESCKRGGQFTGRQVTEQDAQFVQSSRTIRIKPIPGTTDTLCALRRRHIEHQLRSAR